MSNCLPLGTSILDRVARRPRFTTQAAGFFCRRAAFLLIVCAFSFGCSDASDLIDLATDSPDRQPIDRSRVAINSFFASPEFGSPAEQFREIRDVLGITSVRVLFAWTDPVQPSPGAAPQLGFYDSIVEAIPPGMDIIIVASHVPSWMADSANWSQGNARATWVQRWLRLLANRYGRAPGVLGFQIWNEPNVVQLAPDAALELTTPENYFELLTLGSNAVRDGAPGRLVILGATTSIQQNFPNTLRYNQRLRDLGAEGLIDVWAIHYYGTSFESVVTSNGVADFLNGLRTTLWITEAGEAGPTDQLAYAETAWPFLRSRIPGIDRIYVFQFADSTLPVENNFGLRTPDPAFPFSDLYLHLAGTG